MPLWRLRQNLLVAVNCAGTKQYHNTHGFYHETFRQAIDNRQIQCLTARSHKAVSIADRTATYMPDCAPWKKPDFRIFSKRRCTFKGFFLLTAPKFLPDNRCQEWHPLLRHIPRYPGWYKFLQTSCLWI